jgi:hypothetical protein
LATDYYSLLTSVAEPVKEPRHFDRVGTKAGEYPTAPALAAPARALMLKLLNFKYLLPNRF